MKKFEITKEQILEVAKWGHSGDLITLKKWFPKAFESELEVGKWYTPLNQYEGVALVCIVNPDDKKNLGYGFDYLGMWKEENYTVSSLSDFRQATDKEVETALIEESKRRYNLNCKIKAINEWYYGMNCKMIIDNFDRFSLDKYKYELSILDYDGYWVCLYKDGKWAEIINEPLTLTIDEIAERFGTTADKIKICK